MMPRMPEAFAGILDSISAPRQPAAINAEAFQPPALSPPAMQGLREAGGKKTKCARTELIKLQAMVLTLWDLKEKGGLVQHVMDSGSWGVVNYWGSVEADGAPTGAGIMEWDDGRVYTGWFVEGMRIKGHMLYADRRTYCGQWLNNQPHGVGYCTPPLDSKKNGGIVDVDDDDVWLGRFVKGNPIDMSDAEVHANMSVAREVVASHIQPGSARKMRV
eukprot:TRINITY_DN106319_c0_g1_i1.p1 TRINITY_DN106319_c0_g1~~TRINITY_DN106319_c0_g1_i1.p1  ORF type:complete len:217 (-),score=48.92 TRINITY_DN106319_c0_g1_i1:195-845(-)